MSPRNRVTTPPPPLPLSLFDHDAKSRREGISARVFSSLVTSPLLYAQRDDFSFPRSTEPASPPLPSFLPSLRANFSPPTWIANVDPRPFDRGNVGRNEISFQFFSTFMRLWEGRKLIRRKAEDKAGAAKSAGLVLRSRRTGFQPRRRTIPRGEPRRRCGKGRRGERREEIPRLYDNNGR